MSRDKLLNNIFMFFFISVLLFLAVGCTQKVALMIGGCVEEITQEESAPTEPDEVAQDSSSATKSEVQPEVGLAEPLDTVQEPEKPPVFINLLQTVYFGFDSSAINNSQKETLQRNAKQIKDFPEKEIQVQGHCDERGTVEYNIALGERRANRVKKYLVNLGVQGEKLKTISFGEEKPANSGHNDNAWSKNRRVDFVIIN